MANEIVVDLSYHNGDVDFSKLAKQVKGVILRCGYGNDYQKQDDKKFHTYINDAIRYNIPVALYIYSYAKTAEQAQSEARHILRLFNQYKSYAGLQPVIWYDIEESYQSQIASMLLLNFGKLIRENNLKVGLYMGEYFYKASKPDSRYYDYLWLAKYGSNSGTPQKKPDYVCDLWQYTSNATFDGILSSKVDASEIFNSNLFEGKNFVTDYETAINILVEKGVIASPDYWLNACKVVKYLPDLLINMVNTNSI